MSENPNRTIQKKRGRKSISDGAVSHARKQRKIYLNDDEWKEIGRKSRAAGMRRADYIRKSALHGEIKPPDPEFRRELMRVRMDIVNLFSFVQTRHWTDKERQEHLAEAEVFVPWTQAIFQNHIAFYEKWTKILM